MRYSRPLLCVIALLMGNLNKSIAQADRYELGRRLRAFEAAWENLDSPERRRAALPHLKEAVGHFFGFRARDAGKSLTVARFALTPDVTRSVEELWGESLCVKVEARLIDANEPHLLITIEPFYPTADPKPKSAKVTLEIKNERNGHVVASAQQKLEELPTTVKLELVDPREADYILSARYQVDGNSHFIAHMQLSLANRLRDRMGVLKKKIETWPEAPTTPERETCKSHLRLLESLANRTEPETEFPAVRLLREAEELAETVAQGNTHYTGDADEFWMTLPVTGKLAPLRVMVPTNPSEEHLPLVIALHGAGGSENMFFDAYGNGAVKQLCSQRKWILVATRNGGPAPLTGLVDEFAKFYPIDKKRVFLVGHSMGAAQSVAAAQQTPDRFAGVAALGGGGFVREVKGLENVPFFVGVGTEDFALRNARSLAENLKKRGNVTRVELKEYPDVEHLIIVQVALKDVFAFFDTVVAGAK